MRRRVKNSVSEDCGFSIEVVGHKKEFKYHTRNPHVYSLIKGLNVGDHKVYLTIHQMNFMVGLTLLEVN